MLLKRLVLVSFILSSFLQANEEIQNDINFICVPNLQRPKVTKNFQYFNLGQSP